MTIDTCRTIETRQDVLFVQILLLNRSIHTLVSSSLRYSIVILQFSIFHRSVRKQLYIVLVLIMLSYVIKSIQARMMTLSSIDCAYT
jgi:hypothetical protein